MKPIGAVVALCCAIVQSNSLAAADIVVPATPNLEIKLGDTIAIPGAASAVLHRFDDGRIVVAGSNKGIWSSDGGRTWTEGPSGPDDKTTINLGNGQMLSLSRTPTKRSDGKYALAQRRSLDNWKTATPETAVVDTPQAGISGGDEGDTYDAMHMHHGVIRLNNGDLMATMYGNYKGDNVAAAGYPEKFKMHKYRTIVVFSSDNGKSWRNPVTVAYDRQLARGTDPDSSVQSTATAPAVTQEGFCEADLVRAANGDIVCAMRSGGRIGVRKAPIFPTPLYVSRSRDEGKTWTPPVPAADRGVCPSLVTLKNGVIACAYARPGSWVIFSADHGETWQGAFQLGPSDSYCNVVDVADNKVLVVYRADAGLTEQRSDAKYVGTFVTVNRKQEPQQ